MIQRRTRATLFVDADNTLWDTDSVFSQAQLDLLAAVERAVDAKVVGHERLSFIREIDQGIAERHHAGLRYPPRLLIQGVASALTGASCEEAAKRALAGILVDRLPETLAQQIEQDFCVSLSRLPVLRSGVLNGLQILERANCIVLVITEGARDRVEKTTAELGLRGHFARLIEGRKRPELYKRILRLTGMPTRAFMIGDQLDRDIAPAKEAGLETIYFPGGFIPRWQSDEASVRPDYRINSFDEVPNIVLMEHIRV